ncbi:MAG: hypothetical protein V4689_14105 [Verrucomicrobiota bacterium]
MRKIGLLTWMGMVPMWAGEMPEKAASYHAALAKRPESAQLFQRFRDAWLEERSAEDLEKELLARAEAGEAGAWAALGRAYLAAGRTEKALEAFDKAREQAPAAWLDLETARLRLAARDFAAAEKAALAIPEADPLRLDAVKFAGLACLRAERIDDALAYWNKAVAAAPDDLGLLEDLTELTCREGRLDLALDYCGKWRDATTDAYSKAMATLRRSELLLGSQRFDEAMTEMAAVLSASADDSWFERETLARAEQAHRQRGNATGWAKWIGEKAGEHPARLNFRRAHSQALASAGKSDEALEVLTEVMRRSPGDITVRWQRIGLLEQSMKLAQAYDECVELAAKDKSEAAGLRLAELAFRLEKKNELKRALDGVLAAAEPAKRVGLASLYTRYGLPEGSERIWREEAVGEQSGQALRQLGKHLKTMGRDRDAIETWKQLGAREVAQDRIEAAQMLSAADERGAARDILTLGLGKFSAEPGYEAALAELAMADDKADEARAIYLKLARAAQRPDELAAAISGWLRTSVAATDPLKDLGEETADRCLRAAWLAAAGKPLPTVRDGDDLERSSRMALLREQGRWAEVVTMMEAVPGERGPLFLNELAEAKTAAGDLPGALAAAQEWRARVMDQTGSWLFEAGTLEKLGKQQDATALLRRAAARFEDNEDVARRLFALLQDSLDPREALEWAWKRHDRSQDEAVRSGWLREILRVSKEREKLDDLKERFEERARRDPASPGPLMALAELAKARGDSQAELDLLRRAAVNAPRDRNVVSALATLEERSGETARALERYVALARLAPGPDSARQLAQAKIRLGDIEGGMRDLQALAGEKGIDLRALEQSAGDLASRGYVEEAARMLAAVDPASRTARLNFVLGMLLDTDGREGEAVEAFIKVMTEPDDPAEKPQWAALGYDGSPRTRQYSQLLQSYGSRNEAVPGTFTGLNVPQSLFEAKMIVKSLLARLAIQQGGEIWAKAATVIPELAVATPEQWREVMDFAKSGENRGEIKWWDFIQAHPANPLGIELLVESGHYYHLRPEQVDALLKTHPPLRIQAVLRWGKGDWRADNLEFLESIKPVDWQDKSLHTQALWTVERMFYQAYHQDAKAPVTAGECARGIAALEKAGLAESEAARLELQKVRLALLEEKPEEFLKRINAWVPATGKLPIQQSREYGFGLPDDAFEHWRKKVDDKTAEALIARIESPVLRCYFSRDPKPGQRLARVNRELAALPKDAPVATRSALTRIKWSFYQQGETMTEEMRKELEAAVADVSDPRSAFEAKLQLISAARSEGELAAADRLKLQELATMLMASPDAEDRTFAAQYDGYFGGFSGNSRMRNTPVATRWGATASYSSGGYSQNRLALPAITAMTDRDQAVREAARLLENAARTSAGQTGNLSDEIKALSVAGLLDDALARISLPPDAGLGRRVAMITLWEACSKTDRSRELLAEIAKSRPWETRWTVDLALRTTDDGEMRRLLDSVAERGDFNRILESLIPGQGGTGLARLNRLADWAPQAKGDRGWMGPAVLLVSKDAEEPSRQCFRRYIELILDDRRLGELGFRAMFAASRAETPEAVTDAARRALLSGAYTSTESSLSVRSQENMQLAALEHLVLAAGKDGDEVAFPAEFRERLKSVDPDSAAWLANMLAAKTVAELPDVSNLQAKSTGWVALARHEAAMLRAVKMPGRDAWLTGVFRDNQYQSLSENLRHVIREILLDAVKKKTVPDRVFTWLEAAAGPRKNWEKPVSPADRSAGKANPNIHLPQAAALVLNAAMTTDSETLLEVLDLFRKARVPVTQTDAAFTRLGKWWNVEMQPPRNATFAELLGNKRDAAYTLGVWWSNGAPAGKLQFVWGLPQLLRIVQQGKRAEMVKAVNENPEAGFPDILMASLVTSDNTFKRRALLKAAPDLEKIPADIRRAVIDYLTEGMGTGDLKGLPDLASARLREKLAAASKQRIASARQTYQHIKSQRSANHSYQIGLMLGQVIADDEAFVTEVLADWRPLAEADKSGKEIEALIGGMLSNAGQDPATMMYILRLLDSLWKGSPPPRQQNSSGLDPFQGFWSRTGPRALHDPQLWQQVASLSPKTQARLWLTAPDYDLRDIEADAKLATTLREAAKGSEVTRAALEWSLQCSSFRRDRKTKVDSDTLLGFVKALITAGSSPESVAGFLSNNYQMLSNMDHPGAVMAETPVLLAGLKTLPAEQAGNFVQYVERLWDKALRDRRKAPGNNSGTALSEPVYPVETVALLKFAFTRSPDLSRSNSFSYGMTPIVLATGDAELLDLWLKISGKSLIGNLQLIIVLLEKDRIADAVALAPSAGGNFWSSSEFSSKLESLVPKLSSVPTPQSISLMFRLSLLSDARGTEAPSEKYSTRKSRLIEDFERVRGSLTPEDRVNLCVALGLNRALVQKHVPALDEFASEAAANELRKILISGEFGSSLAQLFVPAVCSRVYANDLSGIPLVAAAITTTPPGPSGDSQIYRYVTGPLHGCLAAYAARLDGKLPAAAVKAILSYAEALAARKSKLSQGPASWYIHLVATDAASLDADLKRCGLEGVKPAVSFNRDGGGAREKVQAMMRVALLHPVASEALLESLGSSEHYSSSTSAILPSLQESSLRARISPAFFLKWSRHLRALPAKDLEAMNLYATERRGDFDETQRAELDGLLQRLQERSLPRIPAQIEEMRLRQLEENKLHQERREKNEIQELKRMALPR